MKKSKTHFYRMGIGRSGLHAFLLPCFCIAIAFALVAIPKDSSNLFTYLAILSVLAVIWPILAWAVYTRPYNTREKHLLNMKVYVSEHGLQCQCKGTVVWSVLWDDIQCFQSGVGCYARPCYYVHVDEKKEPVFYFEKSRSAKKVLNQYCPRKDLISQL